ncbi:MAG TPA: hypothetical protein VLY85_01660 [Thermoplasmata archaeon]|nr:hypothetical protein [Thermoplasmata archaeon]
MATHSAGETAPLKSGDLVLLDYELWAEGADKQELVDTTRLEAAQKGGVSIEGEANIRPRPHLLGGDYFPAAIENALVGATVGQEFEKEFAPGDAFGERDPKLIELFSMHEISRLPEMRRDDAELNVGTVLTIRGRRGRVVSMTAARVRVDFNPAFAGRKIRAKFLPMHRIEDPAEQARGIIDLTYGHGPDFDVKVHQGVVTIRVPERSKFDFGWMAAKPRVVDRLRTQLKPKSIHVVEEYATPTPSETPAGPAKPAAPEPAQGTPTEPKA